MIEDLRNFGIKGFVGEDITTPLRNAAVRAGPGGTVHLPTGNFTVSAPVNLHGASIRGEGRHLTEIVAAIETTPDQWCIGPDPNDVAMLYSINSNNWKASGFSLDGRDRYTGGLIARGGSNIHFSKVRTVNFANSPIQFMGSRKDGELAITSSSMTDCISEGSRWGFVVDGEAHDVILKDNISISAVNRHISLDSLEAIEGRKRQTKIVVQNNVCVGHRTIPAEWIDDFSLNRFDGAIRSKAGFQGIIARNIITGWGSSSAEGVIRGILCDGDNPIIVSNNILFSSKSSCGRGIELGKEVSDKTLVRDNTVREAAAGFWLHKELGDKCIQLLQNQFLQTDLMFGNRLSEVPAAWIVRGNWCDGRPRERGANEVT